MPASLSGKDVLTLQRTIGNRGTTQLLRPALQAKLTLGPAGDQYEQEADQVASHVVRTISAPQPMSMQRQGLQEEEMVQARRFAPGSPVAQRDMIQRQVTDINWGNANEAKPSTSGVKGGVFFITVAGTKHVVKASENVGATKFAENLVTMLGGNNIATTDSTPIPDSDNEFNTIIQTLQNLMPAVPQQNTFNSQQEYQEAQQKYQAYKTKYDAFVQSPYLLVQQNMFTPGTQVLGVEELSEALRQAGENKGALQGRVNQDVLAQVNLLQNATLMKAIGRLYAIDTLFGNADRFEEMNVQNAFLRGDNTVGAIDTEAIMQSLTGTTEFAGTELGSTFVPNEGQGDINRYVDFVIGDQTTGGGREISGEGQGTPSSNVVKAMGMFDSWFEKTFVTKFLAWQDPMVKNKFNELGFPEDAKTGAWVGVRNTIRQGFDEGLTAIETAMTGNQKDQIKQSFQNLAGQYGEGDNFAWDAFRIRAEYMMAIKNGANHNDARQAIIDRLTRRENAKAGVNVTAKAVRVLNFGTTNNIITPKEALQIRKLLQQVSTKDQDKILHVSTRGGLTKTTQSAFHKRSEVQQLNDRLEAARVAQLKNLLNSAGTNGLVFALSSAKGMADRLRKKDVDQVSYLTKSGRVRAQNTLLMIGVDINRWGPF